MATKTNAYLISVNQQAGKERVNLVYDNGDNIIATYKDWNRTIPSFSDEANAAELIEIAIVKGELDNAPIVKKINGKSIYANGAVIGCDGPITYLEAIKSLR